MWLATAGCRSLGICLNGQVPLDNSYPTEPQDVLIYGATGDLASHRLWPALYNLHCAGLLPVRGVLVGVALDVLSRERFIDMVAEYIQWAPNTHWDARRFRSFTRRLRYHALGPSLREDLLTDCRQHKRVVYLSTPPSVFEPTLCQLQEFGLAEGLAVVIEKPFGHDLISAQYLNSVLHKTVPESSIFRIDHYLGKETVQNLLVLRFGNSMFQHVWNRQAVESVQITVAESEGVEHRGHIYEENGAIRDVVQNHMMQLLALTCLTPPAHMGAEALRDEKVKVLQAISPISPNDVVLGQYGPGTIAGQDVPGYRAIYGVAPDSQVETYAAMRCFVNTWEWAGVPFYLRTGKALCVKRTEIVLTFRDVPLHFFPTEGLAGLQRNRLTVRIQPDEGISLSFNVKSPGNHGGEHPARMNFSYDQEFDRPAAEAYERLLHDVFMRDHTLFIREDETEAAWAALAPLAQNRPPVRTYPAGSFGPIEADALFEHWHQLKHHMAGGPRRR